MRVHSKPYVYRQGTGFSGISGMSKRAGGGGNATVTRGLCADY